MEREKRDKFESHWELLQTSCPCLWNSASSLPLSLSHTGLHFIILPTLKSLLLPSLSRVIDNADALVSKSVLQVSLELMFQQGATVFPEMAEIKWNIKFRPWPPLVPRACLELLTGWKLPISALILASWPSSSSGNYSLPYPNPLGRFSPFVCLLAVLSFCGIVLLIQHFPEEIFDFQWGGRDGWAPWHCTLFTQELQDKVQLVQ